MPAAKNAPDATPAAVDPAVTASDAAAPAAVAPPAADVSSTPVTPASISTVAAPSSAPAVTGLSRILSRSADVAVYGGESARGPALAALSARLDEVVVALPVALAVADGDLKAALTALSTLLN